MDKQTILIVGEVFIDTHLDILENSEPFVRLGGVFHSARAFCALGIDYAIAYYAPEYLTKTITNCSIALHAKGCYTLGNIDTTPNVMLIHDSKVKQDNYKLLNKQAKYIDLENLIDIINVVQPTDILVYPGGYDVKNIIPALNCYDGKIHIHFDCNNQNMLEGMEREIDTLILSASSNVCKEQSMDSIDSILKYFNKYSIHCFLVKENHRRSYCYNTKEKKVYESPSYAVSTISSVGVGDVFDSLFISNICNKDSKSKLRFAALGAAKYVETMKYEKFKENVQRMYANSNDINSVKALRLTWLDRSKKQIYMAAPDFPHVDTTMLDKLSECLLSHNFRPRLPIRENGLVAKTMSYEEEQKLYKGDIVLLDTCSLLIAVLLYNDPGTLVELGMFKQSGKPTIVYDPFNLCENMFVRHTPDYLCKTIGEVIDATYLCLGTVK